MSTAATAYTESKKRRQQRSLDGWCKNGENRGSLKKVSLCIPPPQSSFAAAAPENDVFNAAIMPIIALHALVIHIQTNMFHVPEEKRVLVNVRDHCRAPVHTLIFQSGYSGYYLVVNSWEKLCYY